MKKFKFILLALILSSATSFLFCEKPIVQDIQAVAGNTTRVTVLWNLPVNTDKELTKLIIYRDTTPISSYQQLEALKPIAELVPILTSYTDTLYDLNDYFYAVIAVTDEPYEIVLPSINATVSGVHLIPRQKTSEIQKAAPQEKDYSNNKLREIPLPYLDYVEGFDKEPLISEQTALEAGKLGSKKIIKKERLSIYVFEEDLISPDGGDDFLLFDILKTTFIQRKYNEAIEELEKLTGTNIDSKTSNRAYFYLAESQYMTGKFEAAIKTLIRLENVYPELSKQWIDSALDQL